MDNDLLLGTRLKVTPYDYQVFLLDGQLQILRPAAVISEPITSLTPPASPVDEQIVWPAVINMYGVLRPGISYISLDDPWNPDQSIVGTVAVNPADERFLLFTPNPDTAPANTLAPIDAVINPLLSGPGDGLDSSLLGQRYLLTEDTGDINNSSNPKAWEGLQGQSLIAKANDIIEYNGTRWQVVFNSEQMFETQYVTNIVTGIQYKWMPPLVEDGQTVELGQWVKSYDGLYPGGSWTLTL
jgi:hypothetical protein